MFGKNEIAKPRTNSFSLHSIFMTIQGEGPWAGMPALFVRLAGCNLRCFWCDTDFSEKKLVSPLELAIAIKAACRAARCNRVVITGGEPLLQPLPLLLAEFRHSMIRFQIETAGTVWPEGMSQHCTRLQDGEPDKALLVVSPKTGKINPNAGAWAGAWKYIVKQKDLLDMEQRGTDGLPNDSTQREGEAAYICRPMNDAPIFVQPLDEQNPGKDRMNISAAAQIAMARGYRLSLQMHKIAGLD